MEEGQHIRLQECLSLIPRNAGQFVDVRTNSLLDVRNMGPLHNILHILKMISSTPDRHCEHVGLIKSLVRQLNMFCNEQLRQMNEFGGETDPQYEKSCVCMHIVHRIGSIWTIPRAEIAPYVSKASAPIPESEIYTLADYVMRNKSYG